jgi:hypothetical protein
LGHEARINDALKQLGEEFRLGMVQAEEYRSRRRALLESWGERDATTSPGSARSRTLTNPGAGMAPGPAAPPAGGSKAPMLIVGTVVAVLAVGGYFALKPSKAPPAAPAQPAAAPLSPQLVALRRAAEDFVAANAWDEQGVARMLEAWRSLDAADRARGLELPSMITLRYKLEQNIQAESQVAGPDAPPEAVARLRLLEDFARELSGVAPAVPQEAP